MEHRGSLIIGLLGFGFVAFVLIKAASQINTHPDLDHFVPTPTRTVAGEAAAPDPTPTVDPAERRRIDDSQLAAIDLIVDVAAAQYLDRVREQVREAYPGVPADFPCELRSKSPLRGKPAMSEELRRRGRDARFATYVCLDEAQGYEVTCPMGLVYEDGWWEIDPETRAALSSGAFLKVSIRRMSNGELQGTLRSAPRPAPAFPVR